MILQKAVRGLTAVYIASVTRDTALCMEGKAKIRKIKKSEYDDRMDRIMDKLEKNGGESQSNDSHR